MGLPPRASRISIGTGNKGRYGQTRRQAKRTAAHALGASRGLWKGHDQQGNDTMIDWIQRGNFGSAAEDADGMLLGLLLAFLCGHVVAWVYMACHSGLSYSRSFVNALVVLSLVVSLVMMVMANNLLVAFGLMAVFAIVRFRNVLRDTLDTTYILASITLGMAAGTHKFGTAVVGTLLFAALMLYLRWTSFGARHRYDLILNLHWGRPLGELPDLGGLLERHSRRTALATQRAAQGYEGADLSYRLLLRDAGRVDELMTELKVLPGVSRAKSLKAEDESEV
ncbi:MAG: DUF4956 domain-containing protein [Verrucomicrobia bacterium]|nr:MAG: DUF4956 domain-containing protein [Verrucomicrobiota bacterium]